MKEMKGMDEVKRNSDDEVNRGAGGDQFLVGMEKWRGWKRWRGSEMEGMKMVDVMQRMEEKKGMKEMRMGG